MLLACPFCQVEFESGSDATNELACPACGEVVDVAGLVHDRFLDDLLSKQGPADLVLTGVCPGCGASPKFQYWKDALGNFAEVEFSCECEACGSEIDLSPDRDVFSCSHCKQILIPSATSCPACACRVSPSECPSCASRELLIITPSKPTLFTDLSVAGMIAGAVANATADALWTDFYRCQTCGHEWR